MESEVLNSSPSAAATQLHFPRPARSRTFHNTLEQGLPSRASDPSIAVATAHKHGSPGLSAINNPDRFNKYKCTTAICGEFMRN